MYMAFNARLVVLLFFLQCISLVCTGQGTSWQSLSISDGLSQGMVNDIMQDRQGFMWFATKDGLNRYDGYNFKVFTRNPYTAHSISGNFCTALLEDSGGRIWIGTQKDGLNLFDPKTQRFSHIPVSDKTLKGTGNYGIDYLKEDSSGAIWIITPQTGKYFKIPSSQLTALKQGKLPTVREATIRNAAQIPDFVSDRHSLEAGHAQSIYGLDKDFSFGQKMLSKPVFVIKDRSGYFWATALGEIICWKGKTFKKVAVPRQDVPRLGLLGDGSIAICFTGNVWLLKNASELNPETFLPGKALNGFFNAENSAARLYNPVSNLYQDLHGNIWASNQGYGVAKLNRHTRFFRSFLPFVSAGYLYQSRQGNVYIHGNYRPTFHYYTLNKADNTIGRLPEKLYRKTHEHEALAQDRSQHFWLTVWDGQQLVLEKYSPNWQPLKEYPLPAMHYANRRNAKLIEDSKGNIWIGHINGRLLKLNEQTGQFTAYDPQVLSAAGGFIETLALYEDSAHTLWIGTQAGLVKVENFQTAPRFSIYQTDVGSRQSLSDNMVSGMVDDPVNPGKYLWVSTKGGGLERLNKQTGQFEHFDETRGLPNKVVYGILVGNDQNLWMSTNRGIARLNPKTLTFRNFNKSDGLQDDEFNTASYFKAPSGELLFGGVKGVTIFRPSDLSGKQTPPVVRILGLKINNQKIEPGTDADVLKQSIEYASAIELDFDQNQVSIEFAAMDFTNPFKNRFRYRLDGIDKDWVDAGTNHAANFAQLPDGDYIFHVQGTADGEQWSKPAALRIRINPPFYQTWWAYLSYMALIGYVSYRFYRNQLKRVRLEEQIRFKSQETQRLAELDRLKTNFFTGISHEFRTPLTLILGPLQDLQGKYPNEGILTVVQRNTARLLALINQLLDLGKLDAREMQPRMRTGDLAAFMQQLNSSFESFAQSRAVNFRFHQNRKEFITAFDADKVEKIVTNLLSNAFKFTPANGQVELVITYQAKLVSMVLKDSGIGISPDKLPQIFDRFYQADGSAKRSYQGTGIGLALVKELVELLQGEISVESRTGVGTIFYLSLPVNEEYEALREEEAPANPFPGYADSFLLPEIQRSSKQYQNNPKSEKNAREDILLVVEDNHDLRAYIRGVFQESYQVIEAGDGKEGLELAFRHIPDLVISDLMMPNMDGLELCSALKASETTSHIPVVMLTAKAAVQDRIAGFETGADDYLVKPFNGIEIKARVRNLISIRNQLKKHYTRSIIDNGTMPPGLGQSEEPFIRKVKAALEKEFSNSSFDVEKLAAEMNMSSSQLLRKLKALTNLTTVEFIREYRLQKAAGMLAQKSASVSEVAYQAGFESLSYFTKVFQQKYKILPSEY